MDIQRTIIENTIRMHLRNYNGSDKRSLRRLLDTARRLTHSGLAADMLSTVSSLIEDENSLYYDAFRQLMNQADRDTLIHFAVNLGYEGMAKGARRIRQHREQTGKDTSWLIEMHVGEENAGKYTANAFRSTIRRLSAAGCSIFSLFLSGPVDRILKTLSPVLREEASSAFLIFLPDTILAQDTMQELISLQNTLFLIPGNIPARSEADPCSGHNQPNPSSPAAMADWFAEKRMLFGYYLAVRSGTLAEPVPLLQRFEGAASPLVILLRDMDDPALPEKSAELDEYRGNPALPLILMDYRLDSAAANRSISGKPLSLKLSDNL